jgi:hypothetical protein
MYLSCKYHLFLDVNSQGGIKINYPIEPDELKETCALDVADRGGISLSKVGDAMNLTREAVRKAMNNALDKIRKQMGEWGDRSTWAPNFLDSLEGRRAVLSIVDYEQEDKPTMPHFYHRPRG